MDKNYQAYVLRLRRNEMAVHWHITLENIHTGESKQFMSETALLRHLLNILQKQQGASSHDKQC